jgi:glycolate oxidase FAD binding subunit
MVRPPGHTPRTGERLTRHMGTVTATPQRIAAASETDVVDAVRGAHLDRAPLRIVGGGTWLDAGNPVVASRVLDVAGASGIVEYVPGDLTMTARAGTTLAEIAEATAVHNQWLPLDAFGDPRGTLGATLATASAGPLGGSIGLPRDVTVGISFVTGTGEIVRGGGRVVKNVAGFDLVRLTIGAWGTLGVITEATVRLRAQPEVDETVAITLPVERDALATFLSIVRTAAMEPLAAELLSPSRSTRVGLAHQAHMLVRLAGNAVGVRHQRATLATLASCEVVPNDVWRRLQQSDPPGGCMVRLSHRPTELGRLWSTASELGVDAHATMSRGVVRFRPNGDSPYFMSSDATDRIIVEKAPPEPRATPGAGRGAIDQISRRLRDAFDPGRILNRGILGDDAS